MAPPRKDATFADGLRDLVTQVAHLGTLADANFQDVIALQTLMTDMIAQAEAALAAKQSAEKQAQTQQQGGQAAGHMGSASPGMPGYGSSPGPTGAHGMMGARPAQSEMPNIGRMMAGAAAEGQ